MAVVVVAAQRGRAALAGTAAPSRQMTMAVVVVAAQAAARTASVRMVPPGEMAERGRAAVVREARVFLQRPVRMAAAAEARMQEWTAQMKTALEGATAPKTGPRSASARAEAEAAVRILEKRETGVFMAAVGVDLEKTVLLPTVRGGRALL
jgi:hypothetical protein